MFKRLSFVITVALLVSALVLVSCTPVKKRDKSSAQKRTEERLMTDEDASMPRADPGHLQYLERQSLLGKAYEMAQIVSGSEIPWRESGNTGDPNDLLNYADGWLFIHPLTVLTTSRSTVFSQLNSASTWPLLREAGLKGLYVAPVQGSGALWAKDRRSVDTGDDVVQFDFSRAAGTDTQYRSLVNKIIDSKVLLGSDLIPAATGLGPDFFLAARGVREYPGIYCMVEVPEDLWKLLPDVNSEWEGAALGQSQIDALNAKGLLPKAMRDDISPLARISGWAATGAIRGVDGNKHRWVYRFYGSPQFAVLNWEDPSRAAHRILSASAVRQVGMQGQSLMGLRFEALQGLEAAPTNPASFSVEPSMSAAATISREIRRYGGWSWVRDEGLPLNSVRDFLRTGTDFIEDSAFSPAAEHALLTGDASLARFMADEVIRMRIDTRRLVHTTPNQDGINYSLPYLGYLSSLPNGARAGSYRNSLQAAMRNAISHMEPAPLQNGYLYVTGAGLAALALQSNDNTKEISKGHSLLIFFKAMQPGVMMLSGQDIAGVMPLHYSSMAGTAEGWSIPNASRGAYPLTASAAKIDVTPLGMPKAPMIYDTPDAQVHKSGSFVKRIGAFLRPRSELGVSKGTLVARPQTRGKGSIALLTRMPGGNSYLLSVCNFSRETVTETIPLGEQPGLGSVMGQVKTFRSGDGGSHSVSGKTVTVTLGPWQGRALLFGKPDPMALSVSSGPAEEITPIPID